MYNSRARKAGYYKKTAKKGIFRYITNSLDRNKLGESLVIRGYISPYDLKAALNRQKETQKPLGQIFVEKNHISKYQLAHLLFRQKLIRLTAATLLCFASLGGISKSYAKTMKNDVLTRITLASVSSGSIQNISHYPNLFGAKEKRSTNLKAFTKWSGMFERFETSLNKGKSQRIIQDLQNELAEYKSLSIHDMAKQVNAMMNKKKYIVDSKNWGKSDYWATPIEFMTRGGDCEDFAIAKYVALHALGVPENRMRIAIVQDQEKNMPHAILVVYSEKGAMILDNQIKSMRSAKSIAHYKPIFSINRDAWWLHTTKEKPTTIVASAQ